MHPRNPLPDDLRGRAFGPEAARRAGVGENRLRRKDLLRPFHGVRVAEPPTNVLERCRACQPRLQHGQFFSHPTAAAMHGLSVSQLHLESPEVHVAAILPADAPHARNVRGHRLLEALDPVEIDGSPVAHRLDSFVQLGGTLDLEDLVVVAEELLRVSALEVPTAKALMLERIAAVRRVGGPQLARAVTASRRGSRSPAETRVRLVLAAARIPEAELNAPVRRPAPGGASALQTSCGGTDGSCWSTRATATGSTRSSSATTARATTTSWPTAGASSGPLATT